MKTLLIGINSKYIHPAMGAIQIAANSRFPVILREFTIKDDPSNIQKFLEESTADVIGFSVYIWNALIVKSLLGKIKTDKIIILGGPEASYRPEEYFAFPNVTYLIKNEGEESFNELMEFLEGARPVWEVSNLYYRADLVRYTFDRLPDISKIKHDHSSIAEPENQYLYLESSRGCPYACSYCMASLEKQVRFFPMETVKQEILQAMEQNFRTVKFLDRSFNADPKRMNEILKFISNHDNHHSVFQFEIVGDTLKEDSIALIKTLRRGLIRFEIGIQSTNSAVTQAVSRHQDFERLKKNLRSIQENVVIHLDLIAGLPKEDRESFIKTFNETFALFPDELQLGFLKELAGTGIAKNRVLHGYVFDPDPPYEVVKNNYISNRELDEIRLAEIGLNKYYNSGRFPKTMKHLFEEQHRDPYETFKKLGNYLRENEAMALQPGDLAKALFIALGNQDGKRLLYLIKQDYLIFSKLKPSLWWEYEISKEEKALVFKKFQKLYPDLTKEILYRDTRLEKCESDSETEYFLIAYHPKNVYYLTVKK